MYVASIMNPRWQDFTDEHRKAREEVEKNIDCFIREDFKSGLRPLAIIGGFRVGKTEMEYYGFRYAWEKGIPAFYGLLSPSFPSLLSKLQEVETLSLTEALTEIISQQLDLLAEVFEGKEQIQLDQLLLPELKRYKSVLEFFGELGRILNKDLDHFHKAILQRKAVLIIDEMEQGHEKLRERFPAKHAFMDLLTDVMNGNTTPKFYLLMGFGTVSEYEVLSSGEAGRVTSIHIPLLLPQNIKKVRQELGNASANFWWWFGRGRPGWVMKFVDEKKDSLNKDVPYMLTELGEAQVEQVGALEKSVLQEITGEGRDSIVRNLLSTLSPIPVTNQREIVTFLSRKRFLLVAEKLIDYKEIRDAFAEDVLEIAKKKNKNLDKEKLRTFLDYLLQAIANEEGKIAFGGYGEKYQIFYEGVLLPLLMLLQDWILEVESEKAETTKNILDSLFEISREIQNKGWEKTLLIDRDFKSTFSKFTEVSEPKWMQFSFKVLEAMFPRPVVYPIINGDEPEKMKAHIMGNLEGGGPFLTEELEYTGVRARFIFAPSSQSVKLALQRYFGRGPIDRPEYLPGNRVFELCRNPF